MKASTKNAIRKYGAEACKRAYAMSLEGFGASGIAQQGPRELRTTQQADAAINAGRELAEEAAQCAWFLLCTNKATTTRSHPILGSVAICKRCDEKVARLEGSR